MFGAFIWGFIAGSAGVRVLSSKDAKKAYVHVTAAALRAKDVIMDQVTILQENCSDIYAAAKKLNEKKAAAEAEAVYEDVKAEGTGA